MIEIMGLIAAILSIIGGAIPIINHIKNKKNKTSKKELKNKEINDVLKKSEDNIKLSYDYDSIPYMPLLGSPDSNINELRIAEINVEQFDQHYQIPNEFRQHFDHVDYNKIFERYNNEPKCRLEYYREIIQPGNNPNIYYFKMSKIFYYDYLMTNCILDDTINTSDATTYREKYAVLNSRHDFEKLQLSNICGVGIFIITRDNKIIISRHSKNVDVYPETLSYSSSGTMNWNEDGLNPFNDIARECYEEIHHKIDIDNTFLFAFGIDLKKFYFQFSFYEFTPKLSNEILLEAPHGRDFNAEMDELIPVPFEIDAIDVILTKNTWEPAAASTIILLLMKKFGKDSINNLLRRNNKIEEIKNQLKFIWDERSKREGLLAVMSNRYPFHLLEIESDKYVSAVLSFIGEDIKLKNICEIGGGIGRFTKYFALSSTNVTVVDFCENMIKINKKNIGELSSKITYINSSIQDYKPRMRFDVTIVSLVLIHITNELLYKEAINNIKSISDTIYIFEHVDIAYNLDLQTKLRSVEQIINSFNPFKVKKKMYYNLFSDRILFLKLCK